MKGIEDRMEKTNRRTIVMCWATIKDRLLRLLGSKFWYSGSGRRVRSRASQLNILGLS
jgi:hypothetical protein